jgi:hypothetical protein
MKTLFILAALFSTVVAVPKAEILDGTSWALEVQPDAATKALGESAFKETLKFVSGNVSLSLPTIGVKESPYSVSKLGGSDVNFATNTADAAQGDSRWTGTVRGNRIEGKLVVTSSDGSIRAFMFRGYKLD